MAAYEARRPTRDIDLYARGLPSDEPVVLEVVREIAGRHFEDGLAIDCNSAKADAIREESEYGGVRVSLRGRLATARIAFHVDVNVGDPVHPPPQRIALPRLLGGELEINGYPLAMVYAEKIVTMLERRTANTRWRDYLDVHVLSRRHTANGDELHRSISAVAEYRRVVVEPLGPLVGDFPSVAQPQWAAWRRRQRLVDRLPGEFTEVLDGVVRFADPVLRGEASELTWHPEQRTWLTPP